MTRRALLSIFVLILAVGALGDGFWYDNLYRRSYQDDDLRAVDAYNDTMIAVGDAGYILYSNNGGTSFYAVTRPGNETLYSISLVTANEGYAGGAGVIYHTTSGTGWSEVNKPSQFNNVRGIDFIDSQDGWCCGGSYIARTTDGAGSWTAQSFSGGYEFYDIQMHSSSYGLAVDTGGRIFRWNGSSWIQEADYGGGLRDVYIADADNAWVVGDTGGIYVTVNGGQDWSGQTSGVTTTLNGVAAYDDSTLYAVGNDGLGLYTTNGGTTWNQLTGPYTYNDLFAVAPPGGAQEFIAFGELSFITGTTNGTSWSYVRAYGNRLSGTASSFDDDDDVIAVGENGMVLRSYNYGLGWFFVKAPTPNDLLDVDYLGNLDYVACGLNGTVLLSTDGGTTWSDVSGSLPTRDFYCVDALDADTWFVCGADLSIYYTNNAGASWTTDNTGTPGLNFFGIAMLDENNGWAVGDVAGGYAVVYKKDSGTWSRFSTGLSGAGSPLRAVDVLSSTEGWICGDDGLAYYLYSGGSQWRKVNGLASLDINDLDFMNTSEGWMVCDEGVIYHSTNGGVSYSTDDNRADDDDLDLYSVFFFDDGVDGWGWACGELNARLVYGDFSPVEDLTLDARDCELGIDLAWRLTGDEPLGFILERDDGDGWTAVHDEPLPGRARSYLDLLETPGRYSYRITTVEADGSGETYGPIELRHDGESATFALHAAYPSPARGGATVSVDFELPSAAETTLAVYDLAGRRVALLLDEALAAGRHSVAWDTSRTADGVYLLRLEAGAQSAIRRLVVERW
ncbi:MAG: T9SS type A sorting domain-containing protein [Candidatus Coatesbacteria bacterium]|nr:T9SS type A sorting domain-containing protein [Candidatus Coatesbacteria bacterium]